MALNDANDVLKYCYGVSESQIMPVLLTSLTTTEVCLMFLIQKCGNGIFYKSRKCEMEIDGNENCCQKCRDLLNNLIHLYNTFVSQTIMQSIL